MTPSEAVIVAIVALGVLADVSMVAYTCKKLIKLAHAQKGERK